MKALLIFLIFIHGLIHLMGFAREFNLAQISGFTGETLFPLSNGIKRFSGVLWLLITLLFILAAVWLIVSKDNWWIMAIPALLLSQLLIILYWKDARWGTIANVLILLPAIVSFAAWNFDRKVNKEIEVLRQQTLLPSVTLTEEAIQPLPVPVRNWLRHSGAINKTIPQQVKLLQKGRMRQKPEQKNWIETSAEQYFTIPEPAFIWKVKMYMMPLLPVRGRDKSIDGKADMQIKLFALFPLPSGRGPKLDQGALQRWLSEICWFPAAALHPNIQWKELDSLTAKATINYKGISGDVTFHFNPEGDLIYVTADRYMGGDEKSKLEKWEVRTVRFGTFNGIRMPVESEVTWHLSTGDFTWYHLFITNVEGL